MDRKDRSLTVRPQARWRQICRLQLLPPQPSVPWDTGLHTHTTAGGQNEREYQPSAIHPPSTLHLILYSSFAYLSKRVWWEGFTSSSIHFRGLCWRSSAGRFWNLCLKVCVVFVWLCHLFNFCAFAHPCCEGGRISGATQCPLPSRHSFHPTWQNLSLPPHFSFTSLILFYLIDLSFCRFILFFFFFFFLHSCFLFSFFPLPFAFVPSASLCYPGWTQQCQPVPHR